MIDLRLKLALDGGGLDLSGDGRIAVVGARPDARFDAINAERLHFIDGYKPHFDHWQGLGYEASVALEDRFDAVVVALPRAKIEARALIARAFASAQETVVIDGQKTDGVDSILKDMRKRADVHGPINKAHGKLFWCKADDPQAFADWQQGPALTEGGFWTAPGVFSADGIDPASQMLAQILPEALGRQVADFGAGWGFLSAHVLTRKSVDAVHLVEADYMALECAKRNVTDPRAQFHWHDVLCWKAPVSFDTIVMNPPFHVGRSPDPGLGQNFVRAAARALAPKGQLFAVANRHLPYEATLSEGFAHVEEIGGDARFKLFHATRPLRRSSRPQ